MVRINVGIDPRRLHDKHLGAEYVEILMLLGYVRKHGQNDKPIPPEFVLGPGHIRFFTNKLAYLHQRWLVVCKECEKRGRKVDPTKFDHEELCNLYPELWQFWRVDPEAFAKIQNRIKEKCALYGEKYNDQSWWDAYNKVSAQLEPTRV